MNETGDVENLAGTPEEVEASLPEVYEIAFHLIPTLAEEAIGDEVSRIVEVLNKNNVELIGERFPAKITLAYTMEKKIDGSIQRFSEGYFGWIAGVLSKDAIAEVKSALDTNENVLRYLITKTSREAVATIMNDPTLDSTAVHLDADEGEEVSDEALDDAIEAIVDEDEKGEEKAA